MSTTYKQYQKYKQVAFGASKTGLSTVGYLLYYADGSAVPMSRVTAGITERGTGTGNYGVVVTFPKNFVGEIRWDTGGGSPIYASEEINIGGDEATSLGLSYLVGINNTTGSATGQKP